MSFFRQTGITLVARFSLVVISFAFNIVLSRKLGTSGMDILAPLQTFALIGVQIGYLGLERGAIYYIGLDKNRASTISGTLMTIGILASIIVYLALTLAVRLFPSLLGDVGLNLYLIQIISVLPLILTLFAQNLLLAHQKILEYNAIEVLVRLANLIVTVLVFAYSDPSTWIPAMVWIYVASSFVLGILNYGFAYFSKPFRLGFDRPAFIDMFGYSWKNYYSALMTFMIVRSDILFLNTYRIGTDDAGIYSRVVYISDLFFMIPLTMGTLLFPKLMQDGASSESGLDERGRFTMLIARLSVFIVFLMWILFAIIGRWFLGIFGEGFVVGYGPMLIVLFGVIFIGAHAILKVEIFRRGLPVFIVWYTSLGIAVKLIGNWFLVPTYGMYGAAVSSLATHLIFFSMALWYCVKHYGFSFEGTFLIRREDFGVLRDKIIEALNNKK